MKKQGEENDNSRGFKGMLKALLVNTITINLGIMVVVACVLVYGALVYIDYFTEHGEYQVVPNVEGLLLSDATDMIEREGFRWEVTDSVYNSMVAPGAVVDQNPKEGSKVKSARKMFISINAMTPRQIFFPDIQEKSYRQGLSILEGLGFKDIEIKKKYSPYDGLILYVQCDGKRVVAGDKLSINSQIVITVGDNHNDDDVN